MSKQSTIDGSEIAKIKACDGYGCIPADYMFVGISAGRLGALKTRVPLTKDGSGRLFQRCLGELGLSMSNEYDIRPNLVNCYVTNLVKARILTDKGLNRLPTDGEMAYWMPAFINEVEHVTPKMIIALGTVVYNFIRYYPGHLFDKQEIKLVNHPRFYQSHGALKQGSKAFEQMVVEYKKAIETPKHS